MKVGDKVRVTQPFNGFDCDIIGTIISFYGSSRVVIKTKMGNAWTLKKSQVENVMGVN